MGREGPDGFVSRHVFFFVVGWEGGWANKTKTSVMAQQNAARGRSQGSSGMSLGRD